MGLAKQGTHSKKCSKEGKFRYYTFKHTYGCTKHCGARLEFKLRLTTPAMFRLGVLISTVSSFNFRTFDGNTEKIKTLFL
jgi:hypothetical protein